MTITSAVSEFCGVVWDSVDNITKPKPDRKETEMPSRFEPPTLPRPPPARRRTQHLREACAAPQQARDRDSPSFAAG
jgi:hypothetical protein